MNEPFSPDRIARYLQKDLSAAEAEQLEAQLPEDPELQRILHKERTLVELLSAPVPAIDRLDVVSGVHRRLQTPKKSSAWPWISGLGVALAALALFALLPGPMLESEWPGMTARSAQPKSDSQWMGVQVWTAGPQGMVPVGTTIEAESELLFSYTNLGPKPAEYLMVLGRDARGQIRWYYPGWTDPDSDPPAITIQAGEAQVVLKEAIRHDLPTGPLQIRALFFASPQTVREVEMKLDGELPDVLHTQVINLVVQ